MATTIRDAYQEFDQACGSERPVRTEDDLRELIHYLDLRYEALDERFWSAVFDSGWAFDESVTMEDVATRYRL